MRFFLAPPLLLLATWLPAPLVHGEAMLKPWRQGATPALALKDMRGELQSLDRYRGKVVVINFWATWCEPCVEEMPSLERLVERLGSGRVVVLGVNLAEGEARIRSFTEKTRVTFSLLLDRDGVARKAWKVGGVPATFVLDAKGKIRFSYVGVLDFSSPSVEHQIERLIQK